MNLVNKVILDGKYKIVREIKQGGFGIVYYGIDNNLNKPVAIKEIAPTLLEDPKYLDMFQDEALNIAKLSHNNIIHIYEFSKTADGRLLIIMEYIDGRDLEKILRILKKSNQRLPVHFAVYIIAEICMALDYAHHRRDAFTNKPLNLVHQDISPSNIMISRFGSVKLIDFGIASVKRHQTKEKKDNKLRGKIPYMSPEQLIMGNQPDHRSDLFSLGLVLFETLTGERLFNAQEEVIAAGKNPKWFKKAIKGKRLPSNLEKILSKALEIDMTRRYQNANHMYIDLLQYLISCNETGELMDSLADYINANFYNGAQDLPHTPHLNSTSEQISPYGPPYPPTPAVSNHWLPQQNEQREPVSPPQAADQFLSEKYRFTSDSRFASTEIADPDDEELKTVIDVIRISARNHKKRFLQVTMALLFAVLTFGALDTIYGWTKAGIWVYDWLFPPAIEITTIPPNAEIFIDDEKVEGATPAAIDKITPGVHKLELRVAGYKPIVKSLFVPREGGVKIQGENGQANKRRYLFNFNTEIEINSQPAEAVVYLNGIRYNQKTPCKFTWEVGNPLSIELERKGFNKLTGYSLNTEEGFDVVEDRRFWDMKVFNNEYKGYAITGIFNKEIYFESVPAGVEIFDTISNKSLGVTGNKIVLKSGTYEIEFRKSHFIPKKMQLEVDEKINEKVTAVLSRKVRFSAVSKDDPAKKDLAAQLVSLKRGLNNSLRNRRVTPFEMTLPAYTYTAVFQKAGYSEVQVTVRPEMQSVRVEMELIKTIVEMEVLDALSAQPLGDAEIYYRRADETSSSDLFFDQTAETGDALGYLTPGNYIFTIKKIGYVPLTKSVKINSAESQIILFKLFLSN